MSAHATRRTSRSEKHDRVATQLNIIFEASLLFVGQCGIADIEADAFVSTEIDRESSISHEFFLNLVVIS
jgi:hypothetical protein